MSENLELNYSIDLQTDGGAWVEVVKAKVSDKTSPNYERQHRIELPKSDHGWQIRARRITPDSTSDLISDKIHVWAMIETIDAKLAYPNIAQLFLQYDAETFGGNIAKVSVRSKGVIIPVASNYDPETRKYNGLWDGTFKFAYTDNNAWHFLNICLNKEYGLGDRLDASMVDKWSVYQLAQYCDELVPDGKGGFEPRFTLNVYLQSQEDAWSILQKIAASFRAFIFWDGQRIQLGADVPQDSVYTYTLANIIGLPEYSGTAAEDRHNVVQVNWDNPDNRFKTEPLIVRSKDKLVAKQGIKKLEIDAWGVTSKGQAQRAGQWALKSEEYETRTVAFKVGLDALVRDESYLPQVGRVIELADPLFAGRDNGGRITAVSKDLKSITLDRDDVVCRPGDRLVVNGDNGKSQARVVSEIQGRVITVVVPFDSVSAQNVWAIDAQDLATMKFRVVSITQNEQHEFTINGLQYNPAKYEAIDNAAFIDERPISIINPTLQAPVKKVTLTSEAMIQQGLNVANLLISWEQVAGATKYQVEWRKDNGAWIKLPITGGNLAEVQGIYAGKYEARVTAISAFDIASLPTYSVVTELKGKQGKPPKVAFIKATGVLFGMKLDWGYPANALDTAYVEIRVSPDGKANIATLGSFAYPTTTTMIQGLQPNLTQFYSARLIDRIGNVGDWSEWVNGTTTSNANDVLNLLEGQITDSQLSKDLSSSIDSAGLNSVEAKNTANLAKQAADLAKQSADVANSLAGSAKTIADTAIKNANDAKAQATETATDLKNQATSLKADYDKQIKDLSDGVTNSITLVKADNDSTLSALNAYKTSNNNALTVVSSKVDNVTTAQTSTATKVDGLTARMTTAEGNISKKLDATVLTTLATKAEANKAATDAVAVYDSTLTIGATNLATVNSRLTPIDLSLAATVFYQDFNTGVYANADETFTASILINKKVGFENVAINWTIGIGPTVTGAYLRDIAGATYTNVPDGVRVSITFKVLAADIASGTPERRFIMFRLRNEKVAAQFSFSQFKLERGTKATEWSANPSDIQNQLNANATAIQSTNTVVTNVDGKITSTSNALTTLTNRVTATEGSINKKADASAVTALQNQVTQQGNSISSHANNITTLQTSLDNLTIGGNNLITQGDGVLRIGSAGAFTDTRTIVGGDIYITGTGTGCTSWNAWYALGTDFSEVVNLNDGEQFTVTLFAKPKDLTKLPTISTLAFYMGAGYGYATMTQNVPFSAKGGEVMFSVTFKKGAALAPNPHINAVWSLNGGLIFTRWKVEKGNKSTDWSDNANSLAQAIDANATAIQNTNASVTQQGKDITSQSASITALQNSLTATNNNVATKADSSALTELGNTVTKQGETLMAQGNSITSVQTSLNDLTIGSVNVLLNSEGERSSTATSQREYLLYERSEQLKAFYDDNLGKPVTISFEVSMPVVGQLQIYASNQTYHAFASSVQVTQANVWQKIIVTVFPSKHTGNTDPTRSTLEFFGVGYGSGRIPTVRKVQMESGNKATAWSPSPRDFQKAIDANASAISNLDSKVTQQGKDIASNSTALTALINRVTIAENGITQKADSSTVAGLSSTVGKQGDTLTAQGNSITSISTTLSGLNVGGANLLRDSELTSASGWSSNSGTLNIITKAAFPSFVFPDQTDACWQLVLTGGAQGRYHRVDIPLIVGEECTGSVWARGDAGGEKLWFMSEGFTLKSGTTNIFTLTKDWKRYSVTGTRATAGAFNFTIYGSGATAQTMYVSHAQFERGNLATQWQPCNLDTQAQFDANASAITTLGNTVTQQGKDISSQGSSITTLQNNLTTTNNNVATKADSSALTSLSGRVTAVEGNVTSQSNRITSLQSSLNNLDSVKLPDTRSTNQSPSWYWTNYPMKRVTEFKSASTLGLTGMGTYVALETIVPWSDSSGGAIIQIARSQDSTLTAERSSTGSGASATWIAFKQNIKDISTLVGQKADASAVSSLSTKVDNVDGKVASQASQLTTLSTTVGLNTSSISQQNTVINGINARSTLKLQAGNLVGGVVIENDTKTIDFIIQANKFAIGAPSNTSDTVNPSYAFVYQSTATTLPNGTVIPKGLYLDSAFIGSIDANRINATSLSAISANLGTFTSTATDGSKQVISGALTQGFYANGQMAFRLGIW